MCRDLGGSGSELDVRRKAIQKEEGRRCYNRTEINFGGRRKFVEEGARHL